MRRRVLVGALSHTPRGPPAEATFVPTHGGDQPTLTRGKMQVPAPSQHGRLA